MIVEHLAFLLEAKEPTVTALLGSLTMTGQTLHVSRPHK
jgi:hypothetical protein